DRVIEGSADTYSKIDFWSDAAPGNPNLLLSGKPALIDDSSGCADRSAKYSGKSLDITKALWSANSHADADNHLGIIEFRGSSTIRRSAGKDRIAFISNKRNGKFLDST